MIRKRLSDFNNYPKAEILRLVEEQVKEEEISSIMVIAARVIDLPHLSCTLPINPKEDAADFMIKWAKKYINGYKNRPSLRKSNPVGTQHDPIIDEIICARLRNTVRDLELIKYGHRLSMSAENIAGSLLEEYIATMLLEYDWHCCWGETMKSIDFCHRDGRLLQIKNSDNSENSSSKTVRDGTTVEHWFRRFSKTGKTNWPALNSLANVTNALSESSFQAFVRNAVSNNPSSIFLEEENPWYPAV
jgi:hypothetical protein